MIFSKDGFSDSFWLIQRKEIRVGLNLIEDLGKLGKFGFWGDMAVGWSVTLWMARMVWMALSGWVVSCLTVADELAGSLRSGDIGPFHVG
ncbi:transmembrane protein [Perilla frutescens var. hirtella]|uniref:Transmembrane protein n=1 Tax=Perilla frutescens var. hirtella TaxID=608512 RepID=A0AAD4J7L8_PERFH|nr:transmembrane protein [Perilla frutescens var. frutescens]KAH6794556.1 transmembrane protein [Perilla frutescens var. hirtella]KAH6828692.1 transmembrane protein [Perilla frutescens var. hirtella]